MMIELIFKTQRHLSVSSTIFLCLTLTIAPEASAGFCSNPDWEYTLPSLQQARQKIKSPAHKIVTSRVKCAMEILASPALKDTPDTCIDCRRELIGLLKDTIQYLRDSAVYSPAGPNRKDYYKREAEIRGLLGKFLVATKEQKLIDEFWAENFDGLADAMAHANLGKEFHKAADDARDQMLSKKSFFMWTKAVRSCSKWDFKQGENLDKPGLQKELLCVTDCRLALKQIQRRAESYQGLDKEDVTDYMDELLVPLDRCPKEPQP